MNLEKILQTIRTTGGKYIIPSKVGDEFVIMSLKDFQSLFTDIPQATEEHEEALLERINGKLAAVSEAQGEEIGEDWANFDFEESELDRQLDENLYYFDVENDQKLG